MAATGKRAEPGAFPTWRAARPALVINRRERRTGTPTRGLLPFAALDLGDSWSDDLDYHGMASFLLVVAGPSGVTSWTWKGETLCRDVLGPGTHVFTSDGVDGRDAKTERLQAQITKQSWFDVVTSSPPAASDDALIVRRELDIGTYATVIAQLIDSTPGKLQVRYSRTPWERSSWTTHDWP